MDLLSSVASSRNTILELSQKGAEVVELTPLETPSQVSSDR